MPDPRKPDDWDVNASDPVYRSPHLEVRLEEVRLPGEGKGRHWTTVHRKPAVVIAPRTPEGRYVLVRQARIPTRQLLWEFPAGQVDGEDVGEKAMRATALRELTEETGYELANGGNLASLGRFFSSPGFTDERAHLFLATPVVKATNGPSPDVTELIAEIQDFSADELRRMVAENIVQDANTLAVFARLTAGGQLA